MAKSGTITGSEVNGWKLKIEWSSEQNASTNKSTITLNLYVYNRYESHNSGGTSYYTIQGSTTYANYDYSSTPAWHKLGSKTITVTHNDDGSKSTTLSGAWHSGISGSSYTPANLSVSGSVTLPTIARASTISVSPTSVTCDGNTALSISISRKNSDYRHIVRLKKGSTVVKDNIVTKSQNVTSATYTPVYADFKSLGSAGTSLSCTLVCETYTSSSGTLIGTETKAVTVKIPTPSTVSISASSITINGSNSATISISRKSSSYRHTLTISSGSNSRSLLAKTTNSVSVALTPTLANYASWNTSGTTISCTITCKTYANESSTVLLGTTTTSVTLKIPNNSDTQPTCTIGTIEEANVRNASSNPKGVPSSWGKYVQGISKLKIPFSKGAKFNASISSFSLSGAGYSTTSQTSPFTTGVLKNANAITVTATVKDSRGLSKTDTQTISADNVYSYSTPSLSKIVCKRYQNNQDDDDGQNMHITGKYTVSPCGNNNTATLTVFAKEYGTSDWGNALATISNITGTGNIDIIVTNVTFNTEKAYDVKVVLTDYFKTVTYQDVLSSCEYTMTLRHDNHGIAFGKSPDENLSEALESDYPGYFYNGIFGKQSPSDASWVNVLDKISILDNSKILQNSGAAAAVQNSYVDITSLSLPSGFQYLLLGWIHTSVGDDTSIVLGSMYGLSGGFSTTCRTTMRAGSGGTLFAISNGGTTVKLRGYGYSSKTYNYAGTILAIPLCRI